MMYVMSRSISQGRRAGVASALGLAAGGIALAILASLVSAWVISESNSVFRAVKLLGGLYLLYIGVQMLAKVKQAGPSGDEPRSELPLRWIVREGFIVELLNPKTVLFFLAFLPPFVEPERGSVALQMLVLGALVPLTAIPADLVVSATGGWISTSIEERAGIGWTVQAMGGIVVIALGLRTIFNL